MFDWAGRRSRGWIAAGLFLLIWGGKLAVIARYSTDVPQADQWDAEAVTVLLPYERGELRAGTFLLPHNEHRIAFTRALALGLYLLDEQQWDARLQCVFNAGLHAALAVTAFFWGCRLLAPRWQFAWLAVIAGLTALPVAWQTVVSGFHSQQYLLLWFSLAAIALLISARPWSARWILGLLCAGCALFTMGSGLLAPAITAGMLAVGMRSRADWRDHRATILACVVITAVGVLLQASITTADTFRARSVGEFLLAFGRYLQWQYERLFWFRNEPLIVLLAPLHWLPWGWLAWQWLRRGNALDAPRVVLVAVGGWVLLQFLASAYARGAGAPWVASRYIDTLVVGFAVNALALGLLLTSVATPFRRGADRVLVGAALAGFFATTAGLTIHVVHFFERELPEYRTLVTARTAGIREYLATGDRTIFTRGDVSYPAASDMAQLLDQPELRAMLPASLQPESHTPATWSRIADFVSRAGMPVALLGAVLLSVAGVQRARSRRGETAGSPATRQ